MPRLSRELVEARETYATQQFKQGKTIEEVQKLLVEVGPGGKTGMRMFAPRIEVLFKGATGGLPSTIKPAPVSEPRVLVESQGRVSSTVVGGKASASSVIASKPVETRVDKCTVDYGNGKVCGNEVTVPVNGMGNSLPVCPSCRKSGVTAVIRRAG